MLLNQPYLHFRKTGETTYDLHAIVTLPAGSNILTVSEVISHNVTGERLFLIAVSPPNGNEGHTLYEISRPLELGAEEDSSLKVIIEVGTFGGAGNTEYDVLGHFAAVLADSSETDMADRVVPSGGKQDVTPTTQVVQDPV